MDPSIALRRHTRTACCGLAGLLLGVANVPAASETPVFLAFETEALDLDGDTTIVRDPVGVSDSSTLAGDLYVAYHAGWSPSSVLFPLPGAEMVILYGAAFSGVTASDIDTVTFSTEPDDVSFEASNTVLVRTDTGAVYKVGNASETDNGVSFDYAQLQ